MVPKHAQNDYHHLVQVCLVLQDMDMDYGYGLWIWTMDMDYGYGLWIWTMGILEGIERKQKITHLCAFSLIEVAAILCDHSREVTASLELLSFWQLAVDSL